MFTKQISGKLWLHTSVYGGVFYQISKHTVTYQIIKPFMSIFTAYHTNLIALYNNFMHSVSIILHTLPWLRIVKDMHQHKLTVIMLLFAHWNIYFIPPLPPSPNPECESYLSNVSQENPKERCRRGTGDSILPEYAVLPSRVSAKKTKRLQCIFEFVVSCFYPNVRIFSK